MDFDSPVLSAISPFPSANVPALNALKMSKPLSSDRFIGARPGLRAEGGFKGKVFFTVLLRFIREWSNNSTCWKL